MCDGMNNKTIGWKSVLGENIGNIIITYTLIVAPVICFFKDAVKQSVILSALYGIINVAFVIIAVIYLAACRPGFRKWELWVGIYLILIALYNLAAGSM